MNILIHSLVQGSYMVATMEYFLNIINYILDPYKNITCYIFIYIFYYILLLYLTIIISLYITFIFFLNL
jgi:hypothetical protein